MRTHAATFAWTLAALMAPGVARAQEPLAVADAETAGADGVQLVLAMLTLVVNQERGGEVTVRLEGDEVWVPASDLAAAGITAPGGATRTFDGVAHVSLKSLSRTLSFSVDERALELKIDANASALEATTLDLSRAASGAEHLRSESAFLNYAARLDDLEHPSAFFELGASSGDVAFLTSASVTEDAVRRGLTSASLDDRERRVRWTAGDMQIGGGALGSGYVVGGLTLQRRFDLDPETSTLPLPSLATEVLTPSTLEVWVDGRMVRSERVAPGPLRVENIPATTGAGDVRYVLRDVFGRERSAVSDTYLSAGLLREGLSDFTYSLGFRREAPASESFDYREVAGFAHHRIGVTSFLTGGLEAEASPSTFRAGPQVTTATPIGQLDGEAAISASGQGAAYGAYGAWSYSARRFGAHASARYMGDAFSSIGLGPEVDRSTLQANVGTSVSIADPLSVGVLGRMDARRDAGTSYRAGGSLNARLARALSLGVNGGHSWLPDGETSVDVFATLTIALATATTASIGGGLHDEEPEAFAEVSRGMPRGEGWGFRARNGISGEDPHASGEARAQTSFGRYQVSMDIRDADPHLGLEAAGGVVAVAGGGVFVTPPVEGAYAVIRVPGVEGVRAYVDNQEVARTDADGDALVMGLQPYYGSRLRIAHEDVPLDHTVDSEERIVAPRERGGALVVFDAKPARYVRGTATVASGATRAIPTYGELTVLTAEGNVTSPVGADGAFELEGLAPGKHLASISWEHGVCAFSLVVPAGTEVVVDLGPIVCVSNNREDVKSASR